MIKHFRGVVYPTVEYCPKLPLAFRRFLGQFSTDYNKILQAVFIVFLHNPRTYVHVVKR